MLADLNLRIRSSIFYLGYVVITVVIAFFFILLYPFLRAQGRQILATSWCDAMIVWLQLCCGVKYTIEGLENITGEPFVFLSNHQSEWETILFYKLIFPVSPILKKELLNIPFWGWVMRLLKPIAIDRSKPREASKSLLTQGAMRIKEGNSVIIFPEGTRTAFGSVRRYSRGGAKLAISAGVGIIPIAHNAGYCWPPRTFLKRPGRITVVIGKKVETKGRDTAELSLEIENWARQQVDQMS